MSPFAPLSAACRRQHRRLFLRQARAAPMRRAAAQSFSLRLRVAGLPARRDRGIRRLCFGRMPAA